MRNALSSGAHARPMRIPGLLAILPSLISFVPRGIAYGRNPYRPVWLARRATGRQGEYGADMTRNSARVPRHTRQPPESAARAPQRCPITDTAIRKRTSRRPAPSCGAVISPSGAAVTLAHTLLFLDPRGLARGDRP